MNVPINPIAPPLSDDDAHIAINHLSKSLIVKQVVRTLADPAIAGQQISLFSFIPHGDAKPSANGRFGYLKIRGNFGSEIDAKHHAYNLIKNYDSYNEIIHARTGVFVPLGPEMAKMISSIDEVQLNSEMTESLSQKIDEKRREDASKIAEIQAQAQKLKEEEGEKTDDPVTDYIQKRVKYATLKTTYIEHEKKMAEIVPIMVKVRDDINRTDKEMPEYRAGFFAKYMEAYKRAGLDQQNPNEMSEAFLRFLKEDIVLPFETEKPNPNDKMIKEAFDQVSEKIKDQTEALFTLMNLCEKTINSTNGQTSCTLAGGKSSCTLTFADGETSCTLTDEQSSTLTDEQSSSTLTDEQSSTLAGGESTLTGCEISSTQTNEQPSSVTGSETPSTLSEQSCTLVGGQTSCTKSSTGDQQSSFMKREEKNSLGEIHKKNIANILEKAKKIQETNCSVDQEHKNRKCQLN